MYTARITIHVFTLNVIGNIVPSHTQANKRITPTTVPMPRGNPFRYTPKPKAIDKIIKSNEAVAAAGTVAKVLATILVNAATTNNNVNQANIENNFFPVLPM